jgi:hypothetical protein
MHGRATYRGGEVKPGFKPVWKFDWTQLVSILSKLWSIKKSLSFPWKNWNKYGFEGFEESNNFLHRNFFRFEMEFKWKIREALGLEFD